MLSEEEKNLYLAPDYSQDEDDEDLDDIDDDDDDDIDLDVEDEGEIENYLDNQEQLNNNKNMQTTPFYTPPSTPSNSWGSQPSSPWSNSSPWGNTQGSSWGNTNNSSNNPWQRPSTPTWGSGSSWGTRTNFPDQGRKEIDRNKDIIFCDILDCLVETLQSNGNPGLLPRGIYDIRLKFEVWNKIACFNPSRIYAVVPKCLLLSSNGSDSWKVMLDYVMCCLSEYLRIPYYSCQVLVQENLAQTKEDVMRPVVDNISDKKAAVFIGLSSGLNGQSDRDKLTAQSCGLDYLDLGQLMSMYF